MAEEPLANKDMLESDDDFGIAYEAHARPIYRFFFWRTGDSELSNDLTSSVFEKAWRARGSFRGGSVKAWLYRIARNLLIDHWRGRQDLPLTEATNTPSQAEPVGEAIDREIAAAQLREALNRLPAEARSVVHLRFMAGLPAKEVAKITGLSESNVRVIQLRALKKMRRYLDGLQD